MARFLLPRPDQHSPTRLARLTCGAAGQVGAWVMWGVAMWAPSAQAAQGIYSCLDSSGRRLTSDRPIPECLDREQRVLNKDGSQRQVVPPRMNAEERAAAEERQRQRAQVEQAQKDAARRDRNLLMRYPDEGVHNKAREAALDDWRKAIAGSEKQVAELQRERKKLEAEAEFYKGKRLPLPLKTKLDANEAQTQAQRDVIQNQQAEMQRVNGLYDTELAQLRKLWAGMPAGGGAPAP